LAQSFDQDRLDWLNSSAQCLFKHLLGD
jgi:hypothetical protein